MWIYFALFAAMIGGGTDIIIKKVKDSTSQLIDSALIAFIFTGLFSIIILSCRYSFSLFKPNNITYTHGGYLILYGFLYLMIQILYRLSMKTSPNPGFTRLIYNTNVLFTFILAYFLLNATINFTSIIGIIITFIGLSIVVKSCK
jgi:drug/metabolite transporter (DMT)-like permease